MANLIFDKVQIEATIDKIVDRTMRMDMTWDWPCGVAYYGICEAYEVTKNERYLQLVKDRVDEYIELGLPRWTVNTCSMGHCLITLYQHTGDEKYLNIAKSKVDNFEAVDKCAKLRFVELQDAIGVQSLASLKALPALKSVTVKKDAYPESELQGFGEEVKVIERH